MQCNLIQKRADWAVCCLLCCVSVSAAAPQCPLLRPYALAFVLVCCALPFCWTESWNTWHSIIARQLSLSLSLSLFVCVCVCVCVCVYVCMYVCVPISFIPSVIFQNVQDPIIIKWCKNVSILHSHICLTFFLINTLLNFRFCLIRDIHVSVSLQRE